MAITNPRFRWDEVGRAQGIQRAATLTFNSLRPEHAGEYRCTHTFASPFFTGNRTLITTLMVTVNRKQNVKCHQDTNFTSTLALPGAVTSLEVTTAMATTIAISWTGSEDATSFEVIYSYTVKRCMETGMSLTSTIPGGSTRSHTLTGLEEDSSYTITVRAINTVGMKLATITADTSTAGKMLPL